MRKYALEICRESIIVKRCFDFIRVAVVRLTDHNPPRASSCVIRLQLRPTSGLIGCDLSPTESRHVPPPAAIKKRCFDFIRVVVVRLTDHNPHHASSCAIRLQLRPTSGLVSRDPSPTESRYVLPPAAIRRWRTMRNTLSHHYHEKVFTISRDTATSPSFQLQRVGQRPPPGFFAPYIMSIDRIQEPEGHQKTIEGGDAK